jgi:hypothetical protein
MSIGVALGSVLLATGMARTQRVSDESTKFNIARRAVARLDAVLAVGGIQLLEESPP